MICLSLFSGAGGGLLGENLLGWRHAGYVEYDDYCQRVIAQRIEDGFLDRAPIFTDIREFIQSGAAEQYRGIADVVTAGFPCQPFTVQGKRLGPDDDRNRWPETLECIRIIQPPSILLENVLGLIYSKYIVTVIGDLAELGYVGRWGVLRADTFGADQLRARVWIVAHDNNQRQPDIQKCAESRKQCRERPTGACNRGNSRMAEGTDTSQLWRTPYVLGDGLDRLKALGNGQVPAVVRAAWNLLNE